MAGASISFVWNGAKKAIKDERIHGKSYACNIAFGAVKGLVTGGVGAEGGVIANNIVKSGATEVEKVGAQKLAIRTAAGAVSGIAAKIVDKVKQCSTTDKNGKTGKSFNSNGKENGTTIAEVRSVATRGGTFALLLIQVNTVK